MTGIHIGIDASNIRQGGGVTHLVEILNSVSPESSGVLKVTLWASKLIVPRLPSYPWLIIRTPFWIDCSLPIRLIGQHIFLGFDMFRSSCCILFSPGGALPIICQLPAIVMSQNMLPLF